ncbi:MAG: bile acid:sodium symporter [Planctomycetota bacterium]|nr:bile acid:sodium symporter [Planctomycetota bacterium]
MKDSLKNQWFLFSLGGVLLVGFFLAKQLVLLSEMQALRNGLLFIVMFLMALPVKTADLGNALKSPWAALYASAINFLMIPLLAWAGSCWFNTFLGEGLIIAAAVPCTLASAAVWTRRAGGNDSVAIFVTLFTNLLCFLLTPFWIWLTLGKSAEISTADLILKLAFLVVLPMILAQLFRQQKSIATWSTQHKTELSLFAQIGILIMVMIGTVKMGIKFSEGSVAFSWIEIGKVFFLVNAIHFSALYFGRYSAKLLGFKTREQIAIGIAGSQKTLMVGLNTAVDLNRSIFPMLLFHVCQLIFDTIIADRWKQQSESKSSENNHFRTPT